MNVGDPALFHSKIKCQYMLVRIRAEFTSTELIKEIEFTFWLSLCMQLRRWYCSLLPSLHFLSNELVPWTNLHQISSIQSIKICRASVLKSTKATQPKLVLLLPSYSCRIMYPNSPNYIRSSFCKYLLNAYSIADTR